MKMHARLLIMCLPVLVLMMITGCNNPQNTNIPLEPSTTVAQKFSDSEVTMKVKTALILDEGVKSFDIKIITLKGDVRLIGVVDNQASIDHILSLVRDVEGVHSVLNELSVKN